VANWCYVFMHPCIFNIESMLLTATTVALVRTRFYKPLQRWVISVFMILSNALMLLVFPYMGLCVYIPPLPRSVLWISMIAVYLLIWHVKDIVDIAPKWIKIVLVALIFVLFFISHGFIVLSFVVSYMLLHITDLINEFRAIRPIDSEEDKKHEIRRFVL